MATVQDRGNVTANPAGPASSAINVSYPLLHGNCTGPWEYNCHPGGFLCVSVGPCEQLVSTYSAL